MEMELVKPSDKSGVESPVDVDHAPSQKKKIANPHEMGEDDEPANFSP